MDLICFLQVFQSFVQNSVDKIPALLGAVIFREFDVFVQRNFCRDRREIQKFGQCQFQNKVVDKGDAFNVPVGRMLLDKCFVFFVME